MDLRSQLQSTLGDTYTIERELGGGGMSRVFLATERALNRQVVIKVLPSEMAGSVSIERFKREIGVAARLQQANIVPVLSAGDSGGVPYFTMPFVAGESLRARLASGGELPIPEAIGILKEVARALSYAHGQGVVHRDIKPDNVLISGGTAMVTDFGVAKALSAATTDAGQALTTTGLAIGTPAYMAPEQASGDSHTDHRADIYAFGCLAYELFTGGAPFAARSPQAMIAAHLTEAPDPVERRRTAVPWQIAALVARCLAKNPADRPQTAAELIAALDAAVMTPTTSPQTTVTPVRRRPLLLMVVAAIIVVAGALFLAPILRRPTGGPMSVAVLPFKNSTGDTAFAYLAEGLSDELRSMLSAALPTGSVKARSSSIRLGGKGVKEAGSKLSVDAVLEGSLSGTAAEPRVVAELVRVSDETTLWSGQINLKATGSTGFRDSLTREIASKLRATMATSGAGRADAVRGTENDAAYAEFLKGEYARRGFDIAGAVPHLLRAIALDSMFARAHASLALAYIVWPAVGNVSNAQALPKAEASANRAMALAPSLTSALVAKGMVGLFAHYRSAEAEASLRRAVASSPTDGEARFWHAWTLGILGRIDEAAREAEEGLRLDPLSADLLIMRQAIHLTLHRHQEGFEATKAILDLDPASGPGTWNLSELYVFAGKPDSGVLAAQRLVMADSNAYGARAILMLSYAAAGRWKEAREMRRGIEANPGNSPNYLQAMVGIAFGDYDAAAAAVERGMRAREPLFNTIWPNCEPYLDPLHSKPAFIAAMKALGATMCPAGERWPIGPPKP